MTDRELWVRTCKTAGAMVGATVVFLGSVSLVLLLAMGRSATPASEAQVTREATPGAAGAPAAVKADPALPTNTKAARHGVSASARPGESI
jgi:hypothetical protein